MTLAFRASGWLVAVLATGMAGCSQPAGEDAQVEPRASLTPFADAQVTPEVMGLWVRSCALCHANGEGGAPRAGDAAAWLPRLALGENVLLARTVDGYNDMPPLGYCMACGRDDFQALIRFMARGRPK